MRTKKLSTLLSRNVWLICCCVDLYTEQQRVQTRAALGGRSLTVVGHQALAGSEQQVDFAAARLDQLDGPGVRDALRGLAVDLHDLISDLRRR